LAAEWASAGRGITRLLLQLGTPRARAKPLPRRDEVRLRIAILEVVITGDGLLKRSILAIMGAVTIRTHPGGDSRAESPHAIAMTDAAVLTPQEIAAYLCDAGQIDRAAAVLLEQRIIAYGETLAERAREAGRIEGLTEAIKKAEATSNRTKGDRQKAGTDKIIWAMQGLLPAEAALRREIAKAKDQGYRRGYRAGQQSKR